MLKRILKGQRGFTLVELVVVTAILGVLASTATPLLVNFLGGAKAEAYNADLIVMQTAVDAWYTDPANTRFLGKNQYPLLGRGETDRASHTVRTASFNHPDDAKPLEATERDDSSGADKPDWNPLGGTHGADLTKVKENASAWTDDGDGVREILEKSPDKWTTVKVTREGATYFVDARYYFVDLAALLKAGYLSEIPKSSSADNSLTGTGSYTYYLDDKGRVRTLLFSYPQTAGFAAEVYP
jgi:prepilin-type N-terminal cleavage/methylation domain-containing protein